MAEAIQIHGGRRRSLVAVFGRGIFSDGGQARAWYAGDQARVEGSSRAKKSHGAGGANAHRPGDGERAPQGCALQDGDALQGVNATRTGVVEIFTDGACKGNPGVGGWGALLRYNGHTRELCGGEKLTTNNRMELLAVIRALEALTKPCEVRLHTDSIYVQKGISEWIHSWKKRDWRTADKKPVKNDDLWKELDRLAQRHKIEWLWVRGHSGHDGNEQADMLANKGVQSVLENL